MSDDRIRELERRWRETGAVEDEAAWLQARLRQGALPPERLRVAAYLDHPAAAAALGEPADSWPQDPEARLRAWARGLKAFGPEVGVRAALAEGHHKLGILLRPQLLRPLAAEARGACVRLIVRRLEALEDQVLARARGEDLELRGSFNEELASIPWPDEEGEDLLDWAYAQLIAMTDRLGAASATRRVGYGSWWASDFPPGEVLATRAALEAELIPWALGLEDPLRTRLERIGVASPCSADWEAMAGDDRVRHCQDCELDVYDLSQLSREDAQRLVRQREGRLCVRFLRREDGTLVTRDCPVGLREELDPHRYPLQFLMGDVLEDV